MSSTHRTAHACPSAFPGLLTAAVGGDNCPHVQKAKAAHEQALKMGDGAEIAKTSAEVAEAERARELVSQRIASGHSKQRLSIKRGQGVQRCTGCGNLGGSWKKCPRNDQADRATMHPDGGGQEGERIGRSGKRYRAHL